MCVCVCVWEKGEGGGGGGADFFFRNRDKSPLSFIGRRYLRRRCLLKTRGRVHQIWKFYAHIKISCISSTKWEDCMVSQKFQARRYL